MKAFESRSSIEYPRKRASIACNFCRHRKRKCDGQKPTCGLCTDAGAQCVYQESDRVQDIPAEILARLTHLETLIEQQKEAITELSVRIASPSSHSDQLSNRSNASVYSSQPRYDWDPSTEHLYDKTSFNLFSHDNPYSVECTFPIPPTHHTPTGSLFALDRIKELVGEYPQDFFKRIEKKRLFNSIQLAGVPQTVDQIGTTRLHPHVTKPLVNDFLNHVHPFFPVINPLLLHLLFDTFSAYTKVNSIQTSLYLVILALGKVSSNPQQIFDVEAEPDLNGMEYYAPAYHYLTNPLITSVTTDHLLPLALFYASLYLRYIGRPIQAWQMIRDASGSVHLMINELHNANTFEERATLYRTAWSCFILECDDRAEFHFPPSSLESLMDGLGFPVIADQTRNAHTLFLAMCSIRKILNRAHNTLYAKSHQENFEPTSPSPRTSETPGASPQKHSIASLKTISEELDRQLEDWLRNIPEYVLPPLSNPISADHPYQTYILARYYATKHIICRPSLVFAAYTQPGTILPEFIFANCKKCVDSCRKFVWAASRLLRKRTHSSWLRMQAMLAAIFTLSIAKTTPSLEPLVPDFDELVKEAINCIEPWARHCETADTIMSMLKTIRQKVRVTVRGA